MKKVFIIAGESSGDALAAWYVAQERSRGVSATYVAIAGAAVASMPEVTIYRGINDLSIVGIIEVVRHLPFIWRLLHSVEQHIFEGGYDEVVFVDYPGFNMRLARTLRARCAALSLVYVSPPQLWVWGAWRVKTLRDCINVVIVLFPFEVEWYQARGVQALWWGCPLLGEEIATRTRVPQFDLLILPGSRRQEIVQLAPIFVKTLQLLFAQCSQLRVALLCAPSLTPEDIESTFAHHGLSLSAHNIMIISGKQAQKVVMSQSICALTKPGTNTLELSLAGVPSVVFYKTSWLTYYIARLVMQVPSMTLPNLLTKKEVMPEYIQKNCQPVLIAAQITRYLKLYKENRVAYDAIVQQLQSVKDHLK